MEWPVQSPEQNPIAPIAPALGGTGLKTLREGSIQLFNRHARAPVRNVWGKKTAEFTTDNRSFLDV